MYCRLYSRLRLIRPHQNTEKLSELSEVAELTVVFNIGSQWCVSNSS